MSWENDSWAYRRIQGELQKNVIGISAAIIRRVLTIKPVLARTGTPVLLDAYHRIAVIR
ncbi:MAG: hypothetical protein ACRDYE_05665 [Acidimicrobiales bacterium]